MLDRRFPTDSSRAIAVGLTVAVAAVALLALATLRSAPSLGATLAPAGADGAAIAWVMPGGAAAEVGLRSGDVVRPLPAPDNPDAWLALEVVSGRRAGETVSLVRRWPVVTDLLLFAVGLEFLIVGLLVLLRASNGAAARRFTLLAGACALTFVAFPAVGNGHPWALALEWFGSKIGMAAFVSFFLTVPVERWRMLRRFLTLAPVPILAAYIVSVALSPNLYASVKTLGYFYMAVAILTSLGAMAYPFRRGASREGRRLWPVLLGAGAAGLIYLGASLLPFLLFGRFIVPAEFAIAGLLLIPLGLAWAMLRQPVLGATLGPWAVIRTVFATVTDPILVVGRDGRLIEASDSARGLLDLAGGGRFSSEGDARERRLVDQGEFDWRALLGRVFAGEVVADAEVTLRLSPAESAALSVSGTPMRDERGEVALAVLVCRDIGERKHREAKRAELLARERAARTEAERLAAERAAIIEERQRLERERDEFFANVSHDLRTPLTAIKHSIEIVLVNEPVDLPRALHRMLVNVDVAAGRLDSLVENLLELSRLRSGRLAPRLTRGDLRAVARRSAQTIEPLVLARSQRLTVDLPSEPVWTLHDADRLERALLNLLSNANQHGRSEGSIRLSLRRMAGEAVFAVSDDGPGIPTADHERVFARYERRGETHGGSRGGSGLGLAITRAIAELHAGRAWVESEEGAGATFFISLPLDAAAAGDESRPLPSEVAVG